MITSGDGVAGQLLQVVVKQGNICLALLDSKDCIFYV